MKEIPLTQGKVALVDDEDYKRVNQFKWCAHWNGFHWYAVRHIEKSHQYLHRFIMGTTDSKTNVDHIDGDGLNCQRENMRECTTMENLRNRKKHKNNTSGYKGVSWNRQYQKWQAKIKLEGRHKRIGFFADLVDAGLAYDEAAKKYYGEFARLNFPEN